MISQLSAVIPVSIKILATVLGTRCVLRGTKNYTYYLLSVPRARGYESFHDDLLVTCINKVNFLFFYVLTTLISQIMKEEMINQLKRIRKEVA